MEEKKKGKTNPKVALILSAVFPGLGQAYNNQVAKGLVIIVLNMVINLLLIRPLEKFLSASDGGTVDTPTFIIVVGYTIAGLTLWVYSVIDAKRTAEKKKEEETNGEL